MISILFSAHLLRLVFHLIFVSHSKQKKVNCNIFTQVFRVAGFAGFFKGIQARVLYQMPATAVCWSTYEFFKFILQQREQNLRGKPPSSPVSTPSVTTTSSTPILPYDDNKLSKPMQYVLQKDARELPAMSSVGIVYAHHQALKPSVSEYSEYKSHISSTRSY